MFLLLISSVLFIALSPSRGGRVPVEIVDMTHTFDETTLNWPDFEEFRLKVLQNGTMDGFWVQFENYFSGVHVGTHMDAPTHFAYGVWNIDDIPVERFNAPAAVVDIIEKAAADPDAFVEIEDLRQWERITGKSLDETVVIIKSGWGRRWGDREAFFGNANGDVQNLHFPGMSPEAAQWLVDNRNIYGVGTECVSLDYGPSRDFRAHRILFRNNIFGMENLANVEKIPIDGTMLQMLPMKIGRGSGAPVRVLASFPRRTQFPSYY